MKTKRAAQKSKSSPKTTKAAPKKPGKAAPSKARVPAKAAPAKAKVPAPKPAKAAPVPAMKAPPKGGKAAAAAPTATKAPQKVAVLPKPKTASPADKAAESLRGYLKRIANHAYANASEAGILDEDPDCGTSAWANEGKWLFLTAYYLLDDALRADKTIKRLVGESADLFDDDFGDARFNEDALDDDYLASGKIFTGTAVVAGPTDFSKAVKRRALADELDDGLVDDGDDEDGEDDDDDDDE